MHSDEQEIRQLVETWQAATRSGDIEGVLELMTEDAVFLLPGRAPMHKADFAEASRAQTTAGAPKIDGRSEIREIQIAGEWAFMWSELSVLITPADGGPASERAGHTLTVLRRVDGRWRLARDANLLVPVQKPASHAH